MSGNIDSETRRADKSKSRGVNVVAPFALLTQAIRAVPSVRYALGVAGIAAAVAIILGLKLRPQVAIFGTLIVFGFMFLLLVFSSYATTKPNFKGPAIVLVWFYTIAAVVSTSLFISSYFWNWPLNIRSSAGPRLEQDYQDAMDRAAGQLANAGFLSALTYFDKASRLRPDRWQPFYGMGEVYFAQGNYSAAADQFEHAFNLTDKKDGSLAYDIEMAREGLTQYDVALNYLNVADNLLDANAPIHQDVVFDRGLINLLTWKAQDAPRGTSRYDDAERAFRQFIEVGNQPKQWAFYDLACLKATRADDSSLTPSQVTMLGNDANELLAKAAGALADDKSSKAPKQRDMMRQLLQTPEKYTRRPGEPPACPSLIRRWTSVRGPVSNLLSEKLN